MQVIADHRNARNMTQAERIVSAAGGSALAVVGIARRGWRGAALVLIGGELLRRGITGRCYACEYLGIRTAPKGQGAETTSVPYELGVRVDSAVTIARPRNEVFRFWRELGNLPRFMKHLVSVREVDGERTHWVATAPAGKTVEWDAVIHNQVENERIAWRSLPGSDVDSAGSVLFRDAPGGRGTEVKIELQYNPPGGAVGAVIAQIWGEEPGQQIREDLHRLKQLLEAGEIPATEGQPAGGRRTRRPAPPPAGDRSVEEASEQSFPASDAPAYNR